MFRQASTWLQALHEPAIVGLAVALFGLAFLLPLAPSAPQPTSVSAPSDEQPPATAFSRGLYDIPKADQYYRDLWIAETTAFYAANPPRCEVSADEPTRIRSASVRTSIATIDHQNGQGEPSGEQPEVAPLNESAVNQVSHAESVLPTAVHSGVMASSIPTADLQSTSPTVMVLPARTQRWRVLTCLAAGLLASLLFISAWPADQNAHATLPSEARKLEIVGRNEAIPVRIPSSWIGLRPTIRQLTRRGILSSSYLLAAIGAWAIVF